MFDKLKKLYPIEKIFLWFIMAMVIGKTELGTGKEFIIMLIFIVILTKFEGKIRKQYKDTNEKFIKNVLEETDECFDKKEGDDG